MPDQVIRERLIARIAMIESEWRTAYPDGKGAYVLLGARSWVLWDGERIQYAESDVNRPLSEYGIVEQMLCLDMFDAIRRACAEKQAWYGAARVDAERRAVKFLEAT